uniref:Cyclin C-terminal domain-containing protein n=1 Tax=Arundo donax TaxID=35708 RepID=A0A0A9A6K6_ARUDO
MQQLVSVACLSIAAKMEETVVPRSLDLQVGNANYVFEAKTIKRMEILVLSSLNWRMQAVTPFSFINYFLDKLNGGKPLTSDLVSRCTDLILDTLTETMFLQFRPSEIAAAVVLSTVAQTQVVDFSAALAASKISVDKENVTRCHEVMQEAALVKKNTDSSVSPSVAKSPTGVLDALCFSFKTDDNRTPGSSQAKNNYNGNNSQACTPASKRTRTDSASML